MGKKYLFWTEGMVGGMVQIGSLIQICSIPAEIFFPNFRWIFGTLLFPCTISLLIKSKSLDLTEVKKQHFFLE